MNLTSHYRFRKAAVATIFAATLAFLALSEDSCNASSDGYQVGYIDNFYGISALDHKTAWAVGNGGTILHTKDGGTVWKKQESGTTRALFDVYFIDNEKGWIVGIPGILKTQDGGSIWQKVDIGENPYQLFKITASSDKVIWAVGTWATILRTRDGGNTWQQVREKEDISLNDVFFLNDDHGWVVGEFSTILYTIDGGKTWDKGKSPYDEHTLFGVWFKNATEGYACGIDGVVLRTLDGGANWHDVTTSYSNSLYAVNGKNDILGMVGNQGTLLTIEAKKQDATKHNPGTHFWLRDIEIVEESDQRSSFWIAGAHGFLTIREHKGN